MQSLNRVFIFHSFNGGQLGNQLRLTHDLLLFSKQFDHKLISFSSCLYKLILSHRPFFFYSLIRHRPQKYLYLFYLYSNLFFFKFLLWILSVFPFLSRYLSVIIPSTDVTYFGFNVDHVSNYYCLDQSFSESLTLFSFLWGYNFFYDSPVISDFTIHPMIAPLFKQQLRIEHCLSSTTPINHPYILVHLRRAHNFAVSTDTDLTDASFLESIYSLSIKYKLYSIRISSDGSPYSLLRSKLIERGFSVFVASSCASINGSPFDFLNEFYHCTVVVAPPSTLSIFYSKLLSKPLLLLRTHND